MIAAIAVTVASKRCHDRYTLVWLISFLLVAHIREALAILMFNQSDAGLSSPLCRAICDSLYHECLLLLLDWSLLLFCAVVASVYLACISSKSEYVWVNARVCICRQQQRQLWNS